MTDSNASADGTERGSPAPVLIILVITLVVGLAGVLVVLFPEQTGVPGLNLDATPTSVLATPAPDA